MVGQSIAHYHVQAKIGVGGMGEVYRATDSRLGRDVALKVLPDVFTSDTTRMGRFEREAKILASLNHPNIAAIYGIEDSNGIRALAMELVEGRTLGERISQGAVPIDEALALSKQICDALEYAHERAIIHRDLKPSNIKITQDGTVKVLDFGLAKALEGEATGADVGNSPTLSQIATQAGILLGTAAYMAPEQARGKRVDRRADIWAFGVVLYEMLAGQPLFSGETTSDMLADVIKSEPDWSNLPGNLPRRICELLQRCLQKDPRRRLQAIGDARIAVEEAISGSLTPEEDARAVGPTQPLWRRFVPWAAGIAVGALFASAILLGNRSRSPVKIVERFSVLPPVGDSLSLSAPGTIAISPDGALIVYGARHGATTPLYLRALNRFESSLLPGTDGATNPFFSPDGQWVGFFAGTKLKKISVLGGEPVTLCEVGSNRGASWGPDGTILFSSLSFPGLMRVSSAGGTPQPFSTLDTSRNETSHRLPEILPGGKAVVFVIAEPKDVGFYSEMKIVVEQLDTHERKLLPIVGSSPRYSPSGHLLFVHESRVFAVPFDLKRLEVTGPPAPVLDGTLTLVGGTNGAGFAVSASGSLVYVPASAIVTDGLLTWVDRENKTQALGGPARAYYSPHISPDGQRVAVVICSEDNCDVWIYNIPYGTLTRLTLDGRSTGPVWSPDGKRIAFLSTSGGGWAVLSKSVDGSGADESLFSQKTSFTIPESWSPDGKFLALRSFTVDMGFDILLLPLQGDRKPRPFAQTKFNEAASRFSPDGHWIAYVTDETGRSEVYVQPFPGPGAKWQVSADGGNAPIWSRNGRELFYLNITTNEIISVTVETQPNFRTIASRVIGTIPARLPVQPGRTNGVGDVSVDGQRLLFVKASEEKPAVSELRVILNWTEELKQLAPSTKQP